MNVTTSGQTPPAAKDLISGSEDTRYLSYSIMSAKRPLLCITRPHACPMKIAKGTNSRRFQERKNHTLEPNGANPTSEVELNSRGLNK